MDKRMQRAMAIVAKSHPNLPEIQRETVAAVIVLRAEKRDAHETAIAETAGNVERVQVQILDDLVRTGVLANDENAGDRIVYRVTPKVAKPRAPKLEIVATPPVNILDPAFLNPGAPAPVVDADKGPDSGPVAQSMLATAAVPPETGPDDESALMAARARLASLNAQCDACKVEIRDIRARMRAAGKVVPEGDKRDKAPAASRSERPETGRVLTATHKGVEHEVTVNATDFAYAGESYKSLSAIGRKITGWQTCDGGLFFGLRVKSNASATPRAPKSTSTITAATAKPAPLGFGAAIAAVKVASTPPAAVPAPDAPVEAPKVDAGPGESTPDADPFLAELESLGNVATPKPAPAPNPTIKGRVPRTFSASKNA